jgi:hypothetical protein
MAAPDIAASDPFPNLPFARILLAGRGPPNKFNVTFARTLLAGPGPPYEIIATFA